MKYLIPLLTTAFVVLKLCGVIAWSWWWVVSPLWLPFAAAFVVMGALGLLQVVVKMFTRGAKP